MISYARRLADYTGNIFPVANGFHLGDASSRWYDIHLANNLYLSNVQLDWDESNNRMVFSEIETGSIVDVTMYANSIIEVPEKQFYTDTKVRAAIGNVIGDYGGGLIYYQNNGKYQLNLIPENDTIIYYTHNGRIAANVVALGLAGTVNSVNGLTGDVILTTSNVSEVNNLYYTNARARAAISKEDNSIIYYESNGKIAANLLVTTPISNVNGQTGVVVLTTTHIAEGSQLYFTNNRSIAAFVPGNFIVIDANGRLSTNLFAGTNITIDANGRVNSSATGGGGGAVDSVNGQTGTVVLTTANIAEAGANLYFTNARVYANIIEQDYATKTYVNEVAQGLAVKPQCKAATTTNISATYTNGTLGVGANLTISPTATLNIDGVTSWQQFDGVLVKNQTSSFQNGRYYINQIGDAGTSWILTRCGYCDEASEIPGSYIFVFDGTTNANTGWVAYVTDPDTFTVGTDGIAYFQFFGGSQTVSAGTGIAVNGSVVTNTGVLTVNGANGTVTLTTDEITQGSTNLYFTDALAIAAVASVFTTGDIPEGGGNLYYTNARVQAFLNGSNDILLGNANVQGTLEVSGAIIDRSAIVASSPGSSFSAHIYTDTVKYYTAEATANATFNMVGLGNACNVGDAVTFTVLITNGATPYYISAFQIDGTATGVTTKWAGGAAITGTASNVDLYSITVFKTAATPTYTVFASSINYN